MSGVRQLDVLRPVIGQGAGAGWHLGRAKGGIAIAGRYLVIYGSRDCGMESECP
jgi:hypothetical protein